MRIGNPFKNVREQFACWLVLWLSRNDNKKGTTNDEHERSASRA